MRYKAIKRYILSYLPPAVHRLYRRRVQKVGYFGNYKKWSDAEAVSTGYDSDAILERVRHALLKVKRGESAYERDSVLFDEIQYSWPLLAGLLWVASQQENRLSVLDYGGSLGSSYFQNRTFLEHIDDLTWCVVEQEKFVRCGIEEFEDDVLKFCFTIDDCLKKYHPNVILISGVLPYLEHPWELLAQVVSHGFDYIVVDRTPLLNGGKDRISVQKVPAEIYSASYPAWMLAREKFLAVFAADYEIMAEFDALAGVIDLGDAVARDKGFIFRRRAA